MTPLRILYVSTSRIPSRAANGVQVMQMCAAMQARGHHVTLVCRTGGMPEVDAFQYYGVETSFDIVPVKWPAVRGGGFVYRRGVERVLRELGADLVYARAIYGLHAAVRLDVPAVLEVHAPPGNLFRRWYEAQLLRAPQLRRVVAISAALQQEYRRLFPALEVPVVVAHDAAVAAAERPGGAPADTGGRPGALQVGYIGHLYPGKGAELVARLAAQVPEADFHVVGGTREELARVAPDASAPNLHCHGHVPPARVGAYRSAFDVLLLPPGRRVAASGGSGDIARWMSPLKLFEYMGSGKPIIASDLPVLREVLQDGVNGLLVEPEDVSGWAAALRRLNADRSLGARLAAAAAADLEREYSWDRRAERVLAGLEADTAGVRAAGVRP